MSRLKLIVNNNKEFFKLFNSIFNKIGYNCFIIFQDYLNIKILKYNENFEILWSFWVLKFYIFFSIFKFSNFLKLLNFNFFWENVDPLPMVYRPPYPWNIDPLPMVFLPPYPWYFYPLSMVFWPPHLIEYRPPYTWYFDLPAYLLIRNGGFKIPKGFNLPYRGLSFQ